MEPPVAAPPERDQPHWFGRYGTAVLFLLPAAFVLGLWIVYPTGYTVARSFFGRQGFGDFVGIDNYKSIFTTHLLVKAIENSAIWILVAPALVTAIGLVFAVLTERIRWAVAFKTAVFMPMAISLFATGVIWHVMYIKDPQQGAVNAAIGAVRGWFTSSGVLQDAQPSSSAITGTTATGFTLNKPLAAGDTAELGLTGIPPDAVPASAKQAVQPQPAQGAVAGVVWRDFSPGGGTPGKVEKGELGIPGVTIQLRNSSGKGYTTKSAADGTFSFDSLASNTTYTASIGAATFRKPFAGYGWLGPKLITPSLIIAYIWIWAGFSMVVIAAGLSAMPRDVLEAARTDGATEWQTFRRVTVPLLLPVLSVVFITMIINVLKVFDLVFALAPQSTQADANVIALAMWRVAFGGQNNFGAGSAIAVFLFLLVIPVLALNIRRFKRDV